MTNQPKIVCIEDESDMIDLIKLILGSDEYEVTGALGGRAGLRQIEEVQPDLVLLDLLMPDMNGWEVYKTMRHSDAMCRIPVIIITAVAGEIDRIFGLRMAGVNDYLIKPFNPGQLLNSVAKVLGGAMA